MDIKLLGEFEATMNGKAIAPSAAKPRQVLALLALNAGRIVPVPMLIEELWSDRPPASVRTTLQTYILQLRRLIRSALLPEERGLAKEILITRFEGYVLDVSPHDVDVIGYEELLRAGHEAMERKDYQSTSRHLGMALAYWRGRALVDVRIGMPLSIEVARLEEGRINALETRIAADIQLGRHSAVLNELTVLTAQHPMHENLCAYYMVSLYCSGRQWQALQAYKNLRNTLNKELGVEPSARLQELQQAILRSEPVLDAPRMNDRPPFIQTLPLPSSRAL